MAITIVVGSHGFRPYNNAAAKYAPEIERVTPEWQADGQKLRGFADDHPHDVGAVGAGRDPYADFHPSFLSRVRHLPSDTPRPSAAGRANKPLGHACPCDQSHPQAR